MYENTVKVKRSFRETYPSMYKPNLVSFRSMTPIGMFCYDTFVSCSVRRFSAFILLIILLSQVFSTNKCECNQKSFGADHVPLLLYASQLNLEMMGP